MRSLPNCIVVRFLTLGLLSRAAPALGSLYPARVEPVVDGDTIVADLYLGLGVVLDNQYIRLYGIDAWEITGEERPRGLLAKEYLAKRLEEGKVEIEIRPEGGKDGKGKYGRWLGVVYVDGEDANEAMVREGNTTGNREEY